MPWRQARADLIAEAIRGHWRIEALHGIRDVSFGEDLAQIRTGSGPAVMATLHNFAVSRHPLSGDSPQWAADYVWVGPGEPVGALPPTGRDTPPGAGRHQWIASMIADRIHVWSRWDQPGA